MGIKHLYNDNLRKLPNEYGDVSVMHIDIDKMYPMRLSNDISGWLRFCRGSNSEKSETIAK